MSENVWTSFAAGELSPRLHRQVESDYFQIGAAKITNLEVTPQANLRLAGGTLDLGAFPGTVRAFAYTFDVAESYVVLLGSYGACSINLQSYGARYADATGIPGGAPALQNPTAIALGDHMIVTDPAVGMFKLTNIRNSAFAISRFTFDYTETATGGYERGRAYVPISQQDGDYPGIVPSFTVATPSPGVVTLSCDQYFNWFTSDNIGTSFLVLGKYCEMLSVVTPGRSIQVRVLETIPQPNAGTDVRVPLWTATPTARTAVPAVLGVFRGRMFLGGGNTTRTANAYAFSKATNLQNFRTVSDVNTVTDNEAIIGKLTSGEFERIVSAKPSRDVMYVGTTSNIWVIGQASTDSGFGPLNVAESRTGASGLSPTQHLADLFGSIIGASPGGTSLVELSVGDKGASSRRMLQQAEHLLKRGIKEIHAARGSVTRVYIVLDDGGLVVVTYDAEEKVLAASEIKLARGLKVALGAVVPDPTVGDRAFFLTTTTGGSQLLEYGSYAGLDMVGIFVYPDDNGLVDLGPASEHPFMNAQTTVDVLWERDGGTWNVGTYPLLHVTVSGVARLQVQLPADALVAHPGLARTWTLELLPCMTQRQEHVTKRRWDATDALKEIDEVSMLVRATGRFRPTVEVLGGGVAEVRDAPNAGLVRITPQAPAMEDPKVRISGSMDEAFELDWVRVGWQTVES